MRLLITNILKKYLVIIALIIFIIPNSTSFAAVKQYVDNLLIANGIQQQPTGIVFNPDGTRMYISGIDSDLSLIHI